MCVCVCVCVNGALDPYALIKQVSVNAIEVEQGQSMSQLNFIILNVLQQTHK